MDGTLKEPTEIDITVRLVSSKTLCVIVADPSWSIGRVKESAQRHVDPDEFLESLLYDANVLKDENTVFGSGIVKAAELQAIIIGKPILHLFQPCSAREFSKRRGCGDQWIIGGDGGGPIVAEEVQHRGMDSAPPDAQEVAKEMAKAAPNLEQTRVSGGELDENGEIIVISNAGGDPKLSCFKALALLERDPELGDESPNLWECTTLEKNPWGDSNKEACFVGDDENDLAQNAKLTAITKIMNERLSGHFMFGFTDEVVTAPCIWGGYTTDGSIVGVLSARVQTGCFDRTTYIELNDIHACG